MLFSIVFVMRWRVVLVRRRSWASVSESVLISRCAVAVEVG